MSHSLSDVGMEEFFSFDDNEEWDNDLFVDNEEEDACSSAAQSKAFWEEQHRLLRDALSRSSPTESRVRSDAEEALRRMRSIGSVCDCLKECRRNCVLRHIVDRLREAGYNSALCKSKWRRSPDFSYGEHSYIDVVVEPKPAKKSSLIRVVVELNFKSEFEMARASEMYNSLVSCVPEVFVGKSERLRNVIKIMCSAAKKCMKENKMHIAPWRKHKYMQSKWLSTFERITILPSSVLPAGTDSPPPMRPRASMLTFDLCFPSAKVV